MRTTVNDGADYQRQLAELQAQANAFGYNLAPANQPAFFAALQEELERAAAAMNDRAAIHEAKGIGEATAKLNAVHIIGGVIVFLLVLLIFRLV